MPLEESKAYPPTFDLNVFNPFLNVGTFQSLEHQNYEELRTNCKYFSLVDGTDPVNTAQNFSVLHVNTRSLRSDEKFDEFKLMLFRTAKMGYNLRIRNLATV